VESGAIYEEKIFSRGIAALLGTVAFGFLLAYVYSELVGPIDAPGWFFLLMFLVFLGMTVNFSRLGIQITTNFVSVSFGVLKRRLEWGSIVGCSRDTASAFESGGWCLEFLVAPESCFR